MTSIHPSISSMHLNPFIHPFYYGPLLYSDLTLLFLICNVNVKSRCIGAAVDIERYRAPSVILEVKNDGIHYYDVVIVNRVCRLRSNFIAGGLLENKSLKAVCAIVKRRSRLNRLTGLAISGLQ